MPLYKSEAYNLIISSFYCGLSTFVLNVIIYLSKAIPLVILFGTILPGFAFGFVLACAATDIKNWKRTLFVMLSGGLYILCFCFATDIHLEGHNKYFIVIASTLGALGLYILYFVLIQRNLIFWKGMLLSVLIGVTTSFLPGKAFTEGLIESGMSFPYDVLIFMSIFLTWQTLFGVTILLSKKLDTANIIFAK